MADEATIETLRRLASARRVPFAVVVREALEEKAAEYRPKPTSVGVGRSSAARTASELATSRQPPRSWR